MEPPLKICMLKTIPYLYPITHLQHIPTRPVKISPASPGLPQRPPGESLDPVQVSQAAPSTPHAAVTAHCPRGSAGGRGCWLIPINQNQDGDKSLRTSPRIAPGRGNVRGTTARSGTLRDSHFEADSLTVQCLVRFN